MIHRTPELLQELRDYTTDAENWMTRGGRSVRWQWNVEGHTDPLTLYGNEKGVFIVEPGTKPVLAHEWLKEPVA